MTQTIFKMRLKKGDTVMVRSGKYKGKIGKVMQVHPKDNKVTVEGVNVVKRHNKPTQQRPQGGIQELTKPIWVSKVGLLDNVAKKPSRVGFQTDAKGNKIRVLKTSGKEMK
jgi:large subunit ribosomal protein L24